MAAMRTIRRLPGGQVVDTGLLPVVKHVPIDAIEIDETYQRELSTQKVQQIAERYEDLAAGLILVSRRGGGQLFCYDGRHRTAAAKQAGRAMIPAAIYDNLTRADEARLFVECNYARAVPRTYTVFRARLVAGDTAALDIQSVFDELGLRVVTTQRINKRQAGQIWALASAERIYDIAGREGLKYILETAGNLWPGDFRAMSMYVIVGLFRFWDEYCADSELLWYRKLERVSLDDMLDNARKQAQINHASVSTGFAYAVLSEYNRGRQHRLPDRLRRYPNRDGHHSGEYPAVSISGLANDKPVDIQVS